MYREKVYSRILVLFMLVLASGIMAHEPGSVADDVLGRQHVPVLDGFSELRTSVIDSIDVMNETIVLNGQSYRLLSDQAHFIERYIAPSAPGIVDLELSLLDLSPGDTIRYTVDGNSSGVNKPLLLILGLE